MRCLDFINPPDDLNSCANQFMRHAEQLQPGHSLISIGRAMCQHHAAHSTSQSAMADIMSVQLPKGSCCPSPGLCCATPYALTEFKLRVAAHVPILLTQDFQHCMQIAAQPCSPNHWGRQSGRPSGRSGTRPQTSLLHTCGTRCSGCSSAWPGWWKENGGHREQTSPAKEVAGVRRLAAKPRQRLVG